MARTLLADGLWERVRRPLPEHPRRPGRPWVDDRACLEGVLFVLHSGKSGSKQHLLTDPDGTRLACDVTAADVADGTMLLPLLDKFPPVRGRRGRPRTRPLLVTADKACHSAARALEPSRRGIRPLLPRRGEGERGSGKLRWPVERTVAWVKQFRRLPTRHERRLDIHVSFLQLACCVICWRRLK